MSEKDTVSSQGIPALVRALGTLALAAATAVAIKWFISRGAKEEKTECNDVDVKDHQCSTLKEEHKTYDVKGFPPRRINPLEDSDEGGEKLHLLLECGHYKNSKGIIVGQANDKQVNISCDISPIKANQIPTVTRTLNMVAISSTKSTSRQDGCNTSVLTATARGSTTYSTKDQIFPDCLIQRCDSLSLERTANIKEPIHSFGTSLGYGKCINDLNTRFALCRDKLSDQNTQVSEQNTVSIGVSGDTLFNGPGERHEAENCLSEITLLKLTACSEEQKCPTDTLVIDYNDKIDKLGISIGEANKDTVTVNPFVSEAEKSTDVCHRVDMISDSTVQFADNSTVDNDTLHCPGELSPVQKSSYEEHISKVPTGDSKQNVTLNSKLNSEDTNVDQADGGPKFTLNDCKPLKPSKEYKHSIQEAEQTIKEDDNNDQKIMHLSVENSNNAYSDVYERQHQESFQGSVTDSNMKKLQFSEKCNYNMTYNDVEHTTLTHMDLEEHDSSFVGQEKQSENRFYAEELSVVLKNPWIAQDLSKNLIFEKPVEGLNVDKKGVGLYCTSDNAEDSMATMENALNDSTFLGTTTSAVVTKFISGATSSNGKGDTEFQNWHAYKVNDQNDSSIIPNGYLEIHHEAEDKTSGSKVIPKQHCSESHMSISSEPCPTLQNTVFSSKDSGLDNIFFCKYREVPSPSSKSINRTSKIDENNIFQVSVSTDVDKQGSVIGDIFSSLAKYPTMDKQNDFTICCNSRMGSEEDKITCLTFINNNNDLCSKDISHSKEKIMSTISENPELILPEYQTTGKAVKKRSVKTKSCDNILSAYSYKEPTLKTKAHSMLCLLTEYYSSKVPAENGPVEEVARGSFICIPKSLQSLGEAMRFQLTLGNCLELLKLARKNSVPELLKAVYTVISDNYLNVLKNSAVYGQLTGLEREKILQLRMSGKLSLCVVETKSIFGLTKDIGCPVEPSACKTQIFFLDTEENQWKAMTSIPDEACLKGCSICSMHNYLFIAGGLQETTEGLTCSNKLFCYNPLTDIWTQLSPMNEGRSQLKLIPLDGYLYAIGGECLHTVEKYDLRLNKWTFVAPLPKGTFAVAHEAAACGGQLYISGGHLFYRLLKYSPVHDQWDECPCNASKGRSCDMVAIGSMLYRFDMHKDSSVNILKYNTMAKMWSEYTATFPHSKIPFKCAVWEGDIYCINRDTTAKFSLEDETVVFKAGVFSEVPIRSVGSPHPTVLYLRGSISQTSV